MEFKGTKGKWEVDGTDVKSENVNGLLFTAWSVYDWKEFEQLINGESWLDMRQRTQLIRIEKNIERQANALLISKAPEMLDMLIRMRDNEDWDITDLLDLKQLIKEATELKSE